MVVAAVVDAEIAVDKHCIGGDNTGQAKLPSKCPHSSFSWITVWKWSAKMAQFIPDIFNLGTEVSSISFAVLDMFCSDI